MRRHEPLRSCLAGAFALTACLAWLAGCAQRPAPFLELRLYAMGTWVDVSLQATDDAAAAAAAEDIESMLRGFEIDYYAWADGELARLNEALAAGRAVTVSTELAALLREARRLSVLSGGAFDPGVGTLVELWHFHSAEAEPATPPRGAIEAWRHTGSSIRALDIEGVRVKASGGQPIKIDLGGIAKGEAVDRVIDLLRRRGIDNALVNAGGDIRVIGTRNGEPWRIGIQSPRGDGVLGVIELADGEAAFTSGDYERFFDRDGQRMHHLLDPRTGYPATHTRAVTVVSDNGVLADAAATALFVAGPDDWLDAAKALGITDALRVGEPSSGEPLTDETENRESGGAGSRRGGSAATDPPADAAGTIEATAGMRARLTATGMEHRDVIIAGS